MVQQLCDLPDSTFAALLAELGEFSGRGQNVVAISGCHAEAGASTLLLALARRLATREVRVVVVDLEFWRPRLAEQLGIAPQVGWGEVLKGEQPLTEGLVESLQDQFTLLPCCEAIPEDRLADSTQLANLLRNLSNDFDLVLLNVGPLQPDTTNPDSINVAAWLGSLQVDLTLLVRDTRRMSHEQSLAIGNRLTAAGLRHWHLAENYASTDERDEESTVTITPVAPTRIMTPAAVPTYSAPTAMPTTVAQAARPAAVTSLTKSKEPTAVDWQSTVVPPWKA